MRLVCLSAVSRKQSFIHEDISMFATLFMCTCVMNRCTSLERFLHFLRYLLFCLFQKQDINSAHDNRIEYAKTVIRFWEIGKWSTHSWFIGQDF